MLELSLNQLDYRWKVLEDGFCIGDGKTQEDAVKSARIVTDEPIYLDGVLFDEVSNES